jgi:hypothetical protein
MQVRNTDLKGLPPAFVDSTLRRQFQLGSGLFIYPKSGCAPNAINSAATRRRFFCARFGLALLRTFSIFLSLHYLPDIFSLLGLDFY